MVKSGLKRLYLAGKGLSPNAFSTLQSSHRQKKPNTNPHPHQMGIQIRTHPTPNSIRPTVRTRNPRKPIHKNEQRGTNNNPKNKRRNNKNTTTQLMWRLARVSVISGVRNVATNLLICKMSNFVFFILFLAHLAKHVLTLTWVILRYIDTIYKFLGIYFLAITRVMALIIA